MFKWIGILSFCSALHGEVYTLTLKQAVDRALAQNPDIALARLDEHKAQQAVRIAKDPFTPKVGLGSGLAYSSGFPLSIEGSAPAALQARATQFLFNRPQTYIVAQAKENVRTAGFSSASKRDEVAFRTASLYLDVERAGRLRTMVDKQVEGLTKVAQAVRGRVQEGRELPVATKQTDLDSLRARQRSLVLAGDQEFAARSLAVVLGYNAEDRVVPAEEERAPLATPASEQAALDTAMNSNKELKRLESAMIAKGFEVRAARAARLPRVDLVAQYALFTKYSHYEDYFRAFQRHNGQLGASFQLPVFPGPAASAQAFQAEDDVARLRVEMNAARNRIALDIHQSFQEIEKAEMARQVASADLDVAREQLSVLLAQMQEGRAALKQVEEARFIENEKWIAFYDAQFAGERAKYNLLNHTGELAAALK